MDFDKISAFLEDFDIANYLPKLDTMWGALETVMRILVMVGPLVLLGLGLWYFLAPPKEANHRFGFRTLWGMGSVEAWLFTQKIAGIGFSVLGLVLTIIMAIICNGYRSMETMEMIWSAITCILWEIGLVFVASIVVHIVVLCVFDWKGMKRSENRKQRKQRQQSN